jgi:hypothetical protein
LVKGNCTCPYVGRLPRILLPCGCFRRKIAVRSCIILQKVLLFRMPLISFSLFIFKWMADTKVGKFYIIIIIKKNIIWFNITMEYLNYFMAIPDSTTELSEILPCLTLCNVWYGFIGRLVDPLEKITFWNVFTNEILFMVVRIINNFN